MSKVGVDGLRQPARYIAELESLRGWAILLVVAFHYYGILSGGKPVAPDAPYWLHLAAAGNTGVTLFFVLSGFLLSQPFIAALQTNSEISIKDFYWARALRILPLYYVVVVFAWWMTGNTEIAVKALAFIPVGFSMFPYSVPWWSLCTEIQFYLILPWVMLSLRYSAGRVLVFVIGLAWLGLNFYYFNQPKWLANVQNWTLQASLFGRGLAFLCGVVAAWVFSQPRYKCLLGQPAFGVRLGVWVGFLATCALLLILLFWFARTGQSSALREMPMYHNVEALLWASILLCSILLGGKLKGLIFNSVFDHFGKISYSLFLVHVPIQFYMLFKLKDKVAGYSNVELPTLFLTIALSFFASWVLAVISYHGIEKPFLRLKARLPMRANIQVDHKASI